VTASIRAVDDSVFALGLGSARLGSARLGSARLGSAPAGSKSYTFITVSHADGSCGGFAGALEDDCTSSIVPCAAWCRNASALSSAVCRDRHAHVCDVGQ
jgi:hypothetical protein